MFAIFALEFPKARFVSHWWGEPVLDFIKCLQKHAEVRELGEDPTSWVCAYALLRGTRGRRLAHT